MSKVEPLPVCKLCGGAMQIRESGTGAFVPCSCASCATFLPENLLRAELNELRSRVSDLEEARAIGRERIELDRDFDRGLVRKLTMERDEALSRESRLSTDLLSVARRATTTAAKIHAGMSLILLHEPDADISALHDEIYFGGDVSRSAMSPEELEVMERLGWTWDDDGYSSWRRFT